MKSKGRSKYSGYLSVFLLLLGLSALYTSKAVGEMADLPRDSYRGECLYGPLELTGQEGGAETVLGIDTADGDFFQISGLAENRGTEEAEIRIRCGTEESDHDGCRYVIAPGESSGIADTFSFGESIGTGIIRIAVTGSGMRFTDVTVRQGERISGNTLPGLMLCRGLAVLGSVCIVCCFVAAVVTVRTWKSEKRSFNRNHLCELLLYVSVAGIVLLFLFLIYRNADIRKPLQYANYGRDEMNVFYMVHMIQQGNYNLLDPYMGGTLGGDLFDHPSSDRGSFALIRILSLFTSDTYLITNLFYFLCFILNALSGCLACRILRLKRSQAAFVAILFSFPAFAQCRYEHMWLMPYGILAVVTALCVRAVECGLEDDGNGFREMIAGALIAGFLAAQAGAYYAFFSCVIFGASAVCLAVCQGKINKDVFLFLLPIIGSAGAVLLNILPNLGYSILCGQNPESEVSMRMPFVSEVYGLRIFRMLLPRADHRFPLFRVLSEYASGIPAAERELYVNESIDAALGLLGTAGFLITLVWLLGKQKDCRKKCLAALTLFIVLTAVSGGLGTVFALFVSAQMRSTCRMSVIVLFISLVSLAIVIDEKIIPRLRGGSRYVFLAVLLAAGVADQTTDYRPDPSDISAYLEYSAFLADAEEMLPEESYVFVLPYHRFPSGGSPNYLTASIETERLHFSAAAIQGRRGDLWNRHVAAAKGGEKLEYLQNAGYDAVYLDRELAEVMSGSAAAEEAAGGLLEAFGEPDLTSVNGRYILWRIR